MLFTSTGKNHAPVSVEPDDAQRLAQAIHGAGMGGAARVALEVLRPLHWLAGQFAWALEPFLGAFAPFSRPSATSIDGMARLLEREDGVSELAGHLDSLLEQDSYRAGKIGEETER